VRPSPPKL